MIITHDVGQSISLTLPGADAPLWVLQYGSTPKPHFSSLRTPAGNELALVEPVDHLWHRGLWFAIKFVNGVNFWEERDEFGSQKIAGIPEVRCFNDAVVITMSIVWAQPNGAVPIREVRTITWRPGDETYRLDWEFDLHADEDVIFDRTPYTTWGGYSGLSFRGSRSWHIERYLLPTGPEKPLPAGVHATWCDLSGYFDGGKDRAGGIAMLDAPDIVSEGTTPWYGGGNPAMNFLNAAFLFDGPMELKQGHTLHFSQGTVVHNGIWDAAQVEAAHKRWFADDAEDES